MEEKFIFKDTAFKHNVLEPDIRKAFEQRLLDHALLAEPCSGEEQKYLLIGFDRNGHLLEIMYNVLDEGIINVFHAMKCRKAYEKLLNA